MDECTLETPDVPADFIEFLADRAEDTLATWLTTQGAPEGIVGLVANIRWLTSYATRARAADAVCAVDNDEVMDTIREVVNGINEAGGGWTAQAKEAGDAAVG